MSDLIDRQSAIDIADDLRACIRVDGYWAWMERLKKLPSAEPEIIRCKDCKWYQEYISVFGSDMMCLCPCCIGGQGKKKPDDYCSRAERRTDE